MSRHRDSSSIAGFNFSGELSDSARFFTVPVTRKVEGQDGLVVLFRQFDSSQFQTFPEDLLAGWVPPEDEVQAQEWVEQMNTHLKALLQSKYQQKQD